MLAVHMLVMSNTENRTCYIFLLLMIHVEQLQLPSRIYTSWTGELHQPT